MFHLRLLTFTGFALQALGEKPALLQHKGAVQQVQRLQCRGAARSLRRYLSGVRTIKHSENPVRPLPNHRAVNHPPKCRLVPLVARLINSHVIFVGFEKTESRAAHSPVQLSADTQDPVTKRLGFQTSWWKSP